MSVNGNGCGRKETISSIALGKKRSGIGFENIRQQIEKCSRRKITETNLKNDVLSMFFEARYVFCHKKSDGISVTYGERYTLG